MSNRHLARSIVMQTLFEYDFRPEGEPILERLERNIEEFGPGIESIDYPKMIAEGVVKKREILDEVIEKAAPDWPLDKIAVVDRNVLRLGLFELLFGDKDEVPPKVAINEAIELAKKYGGEKSGAFVNGVLGAIYKEMGEPGKEQKSKKQKAKEEVDLDELPIEQKAGAVIYSKDDKGVVRLAFVHDVFGYWTLSKSSVQDGEEPKDAAKRAVQEEMGLTAEIVEKLGENEYLANHPEKGKIRKQVQYFLGIAPHEAVSLVKESGGLDDARWFELGDVAGLHTYDDIVQMITKAVEIITQS